MAQVPDRRYVYFVSPCYAVSYADSAGLLLRCVLRRPPHESGKPKAIVGYTIKGKGVSFMENNNDWHHNRLTDIQLAAALAELEAAE